MRSSAAFALAALVVAAPVPATAHTSDPAIVTRVDAVQPRLPGVVVEVRAGAADQLLVVNTTRTPVEVLGADGTAYLRIGPDEVVADVASADWHASNSPSGSVPPGVTAGVTTEQRWTRVARGGSWGWFDHRMHERDRPLTPELRAARGTVRLAGWTVPLRHGTTDVAVRGHVEYRPVRGAMRTHVTHRPPGVEADVVDGRVPALSLRWSGGGELVVRGVAGEPFARLTRDGTDVNDASPTWQEDQRLRGNAVTVPADPGGVPRWRRAGAGARLSWLDRRLAYTPGFPPDDVARADDETTLVEWHVPVEVNGTPYRLRGTTTWVPAEVAERRERAAYGRLALLGLPAVVVLAVVGLRRFRAR